MKRRDQGFTLIEILMVLILIAVLAAVGLNSFINFKTEAKDAALRSNLAALRAAIGAQYSQMQLRCGTSPGTFPPLLNLQKNDITWLDAPCIATAPNTQIAIESERKFLQAGIPANPWAPSSDTTPNDIVACVDTAACNRTSPCDGVGYTDNWCYNSGTGEIWSDSNPDSTIDTTNTKHRENW